MPGKFSGNGSAASGTDKTILTLISAATIRPKISEFVIGSVAAPADTAAKLHVARFTAVGTEGSGFAPIAIDPAYATLALADYGVGVFSVEPTYTASAILAVVSMNQRITFRWVAQPGYELIAPATAASGTGFKTSSVSSGTAAYEITCFHEE